MSGSNLPPTSSSSSSSSSPSPLGPPSSSSGSSSSSLGLRTSLGLLSSSTSLAATPSGSATGNPRNKVSLRPGRSLMDWVQLGHSGTDLSGVGGKVLDITPSVLAKHNKPKDCWIALKGKVYNVTSYLEFHPGGEEELMRGAGIDATTLFNEIHKWVNFETMLQKCLVGRLVESRSFFHKPSFLPRPRTHKTNNNNKADPAITKASLVVPSMGPPVTVPPASSSPTTASGWPPTPAPLPTPKYDWFQTDKLLTVVVYTRWQQVKSRHVAVIKTNTVVKVVCQVQDMTYTLHLSPARPLNQECRVVVRRGGKVEVVLSKEQAGQRWSSLGKTLEGHGEYVKNRDRKTEFVGGILVRKEWVTHDTRLFVLEVPPPSLLPLPVGYHVFIRVPGREEVVKPYTPVAAALRVGPEEEEEEEGRYIYLFIKIYPGGALTPMLDELDAGAGLEVSLPEGSFSHDYLAAATSATTTLALLAAGTGITPMISLMLAAIANTINVHLILFNKTEEDIPWRDELDALAQQHSNLFKVTHVLSQAGEGWTGHHGRVRAELVESLLPRPSTDQALLLCACGPTPFTKLVFSLVQEAGHSSAAFNAFLA